MNKKARRVPERISDMREALENIRSPDIEHNHPEAWKYFKDAYGMRIILTHEYFRVDASVVWDTTKTDLPELERLLKDLGAGSAA